MRLLSLLKKNMNKLILLASLLYLLISPFTYHPDTKLTLYYPSLNDGKVTNIYKFLNENSSDYSKFHYPPVHFWFLKGQYVVSNAIAGEGFNEWLSVGGSRSLDTDNLYRYIFATKLPILALVIFSGLIIYWITKSNMAAAFWLFNPVTIYSAVMMGQNDIFALFPFVLGLVFYFKKPYLAFTLFGFGAAVKTFPLIWVILLGLAHFKSGIVKKLSLIGIPFLMYAASLLPYIREEGFLSDVMYSGLSERMFISNISLGFGDVVMIVPLLLSFLAFLIISGKIKVGNYLDLSMLLLTSNLMVLGFTHFHPQWFLWTIPFVSIIIGLGKGKRYGLVFGLLFAFWSLVVVLFNDKYLIWGIVSPLNKGLLNMPHIHEIFSKVGVDPVLLNNLAHSALAASGLYFLYELLGKKSKAKVVSLVFGKKELSLVLGMTTFFMLAVSLIPSIVNFSNSSAESYYKNATEVVSRGEFKSMSDNLYRIELRARNISLLPGLIKVEVFDESGVVISKNFDEVNIGIEGNLRVDFDGISNSKDKVYFVSVRASDNYEIKSIEDNIFIESFYKKSSLVSGAKSLLGNVISAVCQMPLWFVLIVLNIGAYLFVGKKRIL